MPYRKLLYLLAMFVSTGLWAQDDAMDAAVPRLTALTETIYTDSSETARYQACRDLIRELVTTLDRPNSFLYDFGEIPGLSIQYPADSSFRIFSWELYVDRDTYRHYGAIQKNTPDLQLIPLVDRGSEWLENPENFIAGADNWLGYAVYHIEDAGTYRGRPYYFVFGYDSYEAYRRRKIMDVLSFDGEGRPQFGLPIFDTFTEAGLPLDGRARLIMMYGAEATVALRFDPEQGGVVYENLIMMPSTYGEGPVQMPDGSYHMLQLGADGRWHEEEQLFKQTYKEAPREVPRPSEGRDILGRDSTQRRGGGGI